MLETNSLSFSAYSMPRGLRGESPPMRPCALNCDSPCRLNQMGRGCGGLLGCVVV